MLSLKQSKEQILGFLTREKPADVTVSTVYLNLFDSKATHRQKWYS